MHAMNIIILQQGMVQGYSLFLVIYFITSIKTKWPFPASLSHYR